MNKLHKQLKQQSVVTRLDHFIFSHRYDGISLNDAITLSRCEEVNYWLNRLAEMPNHWFYWQRIADVFRSRGSIGKV